MRESRIERERRHPTCYLVGPHGARGAPRSPCIALRIRHAMATLKSFIAFIDRLDEEDIQYTITSSREGVATVGVTVDEEHWQFEFLTNGRVEVQVFVSDGEVEGESGIDRFFDEHTGKDDEEEEEDEDEDEDEEEEEEEEDEDFNDDDDR